MSEDGGGRNRLIPAFRHRMIQEVLAKRKLVTTAELVRLLGASEVTIRRDLVALEEEGLLKRTRGGAKLLVRPLEVEERFAAREQKNAAAKRVIGELAAGLIQSGEAIGVNDGSTVMQFAKQLVTQNREVFVVTNALNVAIALLEGSQIDVSVVGGVLRRTSFGTVWPTDAMTEPFRLDTAVLGADGLDSDEGVAMHHPFDTAFAERLIRRADRVIVVADSSKWTQRAKATLCAWSNVDVLVSEECGEHMRARLRRQGVDVVVPG